MRIKRIELESFGKFSVRALNLTDGLNIIYGGNGAGKSTIMAFIRLMFYGKAANDKSGDIEKNMRKKYRPFGGGEMSGSIEFEHDGIDYRLSKQFNKSSVSDVVVLWNITHGEKTTLSADTEVGRLFFDMDAGEFERSVFIDRGGGFSSDFSGESLAMRTRNLSTTADENVSYKLVLERLNKAKEKLTSRSGKNGLIPELVMRFEALTETLYKTKREIEAQDETNRKISRLSAELDRIDAAITNIDRSAAFTAAEQKYKGVSQLLSKLTELSELKAAGYSPLSPIDRDYLIAERRQLQNDISVIHNTLLPIRKKLDELGAKKSRSALRLPLSLLLLLASGTICVSTYMGLIDKYCYIAAGLAAALAAVMLMKGKGSPARLEKEYAEALSAITFEHRQLPVYDLEAEIHKRLDEIYLTLNSPVAELDRETKLLADSLGITSCEISDVKTILSVLDAEMKKYAPHASGAAASAAVSGAAVSGAAVSGAAVSGAAASAGLEGLSLEGLKELRGAKSLELNNLYAHLREVDHSLEALEEKIAAVTKELKRLRDREAAIDTAISELTDAANENRRGFGAQLEKLTRDYLRLMSAEDKSDVIISGNMEIDYRAGDIGDFHSYKHLSQGMIDKVYLALRLATAEIIADSKNTSLPLFFDDYLAVFDDENCRLAAILLGELIERKRPTGQILMFTCHSHICEYLNSNAGQVNLIEL